MDNLLQKFREHHPNPPHLSTFFLGYLQAKLYLDPDLIIDLLNQIYYSQFAESEIKEMEKLLFTLNLKELNDYIINRKKLLQISQLRASAQKYTNVAEKSLPFEGIIKCLLCEIELNNNEIVYLDCLHPYHKGCILMIFRNDIETEIFPLCPVCGVICDKKTLESLDYQIFLDYQGIAKKKIEAPQNWHIYWCIRCAVEYIWEYKEDSKCPNCESLLEYVKYS